MKKHIQSNFRIMGTSGSNLIIKCIFCGDDRHLWIDPDKGVFHCFKCEAKGNNISFLMAHLNKSFKEITELINDNKTLELNDIYEELLGLYEARSNESDRLIDNLSFYEMAIPDSHCVELDVASETCKKYLISKRHHSLAFLKKYGFKFCVQGYYNNRLIIPIETLGHKSFQAYSIKKSDKKVLNPKGSKKSLFLYLYNYFRKEDIVILTEGIFDALRLVNFGYNSMAILGKTLSNQQKKLLLKTKIKEVVFCLDNDAYEDMVREAELLSKVFDGKVSIIQLGETDKDPGDITNKEVFNNYFKGRTELSELNLLQKDINQLNLN